MAWCRHMGSAKQSRHTSHTVVIEIGITKYSAVNPVKEKNAVTCMCNRGRHSSPCCGQRSDSFLITILAQSIYRLADPQGPNPGSSRDPPQLVVQTLPDRPFEDHISIFKPRDLCKGSSRGGSHRFLPRRWITIRFVSQHTWHLAGKTRLPKRSLQRCLLGKSSRSLAGAPTAAPAALARLQLP